MPRTCSRRAGTALDALRTEPTGEHGKQPIIPVTYMNSVCRAQGVLWRERRHRVYLVECPSGPEVGVRARRARAVLPRSAPWPQHRPRPWASRWTRWRCGTRASRSAEHSERCCKNAKWCSGTASARCTNASRSARSNKAREEFPGVNVIVHPEAPMPVVDAADASGLDRRDPQVRRGVTARRHHRRSAPRSTWSTASPRSTPTARSSASTPVVCPCSTMYRIHPGLSRLDTRRSRRGGVPQRDHRRRRHRDATPRSPSSACLPRCPMSFL